MKQETRQWHMYDTSVRGVVSEQVTLTGVGIFTAGRLVQTLQLLFYNNSAG